MSLKEFSREYRHFLVLKGRSYDIKNYPDSVADNANKFYKAVANKFQVSEYNDLLTEFALQFSGYDIQDWYNFIDLKVRSREADARNRRDERLRPVEEDAGRQVDPEKVRAFFKFFKEWNSTIADERKEKFDSDNYDTALKIYMKKHYIPPQD